MRNVLKLILLALIVYLAYTRVLPILRAPVRSTPASDGMMSTGEIACPDLASLASGTWGAGLSRFVNPPYRMEDWNPFHSDVVAKLRDAKDGCRCTSSSCAKAREAVAHLDTLVTSVDAAVRAGAAMPSDAPQQQDRVDQEIDAAKALARAGK